MLVQIFTPTIQEKLTEIIFRKTYGVSIKKKPSLYNQRTSLSWHEKKK